MIFSGSRKPASVEPLRNVTRWTALPPLSRAHFQKVLGVEIDRAVAAAELQGDGRGIEDEPVAGPQLQEGIGK